MRRLVAALPWHLRKSISDVRANWRGRRPSFEGVYGSFNEFSSTIADAEDDMVKVALAGLAESRKHRPGDLVQWRRGRGPLSQIVAMLGADGLDVRVLDFGGAAGADFNNLLISNGQEANIRYHVVDLPKVCAAARRQWCGEARIEFSSELPQETERFDLVYSWGAIQYVPDPAALLRSFARYRPAAILIIGVAVAARGFVRSQINQSRPFPNWVVGLSDAENAMKEVGYRLASRQATGENHNVDNFDDAHKVPDYASLLFVRDRT